MKLIKGLIKFIPKPSAIKWLIVSIFIVTLTFVSAKAEAKKISFIRDTEIEHILRTYATPIFQVAGLEPSAINIYLVKDKALNAFVAGGQKLFLNTGLLMRSETAGQIIAIIAHETGHISGGHLSGIRDAMKNSSAASILASILGGLASMGGYSKVGSAIAVGGKGMSTRNYLQYSRTQEGSADAAALRFLEQTGQSSIGMLSFFKILGDQELLSARRQDPYYRSHPLTRERINTVRAFMKRSKYTEKPDPPGFIQSHARMKAKLRAFINPPSRTLLTYKKDDKRVEARYARAIAYYRIPKLTPALALIDGLINDYPTDPFFQELKGQILFENGNIDESLPFYEKAVLLGQGSHLLHRALGRVLIETGNPALLQKAIKNLNIAINSDKSDPFTWRLLGTAYGKAGKLGKSSLALAEEALLNRKPADAKFHSERAASLFEEGTADWLQAMDILQTLKNKKPK